MIAKNFEERKRKFIEATSKGVSRDEHLQRQKIASSVWKELVNIYDENELVVIDPTSVFCDEDRCAFMTEEFAIYTDYDHASEQGYDRLEASFTNALGF